MRVLLLHSPFLGPSSLGPLRSYLEAQGCEALAPNLHSAVAAGAGAYERVAEQVGGLMSEGAVLVVHSGAGAFVPSIQRAASSSLKTVAFLDALLPHPRRSWFDTLPIGMAEGLRKHSVDGFAPPWPAWLPPGMLERLLPDAEMRSAIVKDAPRAPLAYLLTPAPAVEDWMTHLRIGYLQLSEAYSSEAKEAERLGWRLDRLNASHLGTMTHPQLVGASVLRLVARLAADHPTA